LTARSWAFPAARPPIWDGAAGIPRADRRRRATRSRGRKPAGGERWDLGEAALLPGLVNSHTHLEIGANPPGDPAQSFVPWVQRVIERRKWVALEEQARTAEAGAWALLRSGTTSVGEVSTTGQSLAPLLRVGLRGVVYREILGLDPAEAPDRLAPPPLTSRRGRRPGSRLATASPHSAYALSEDLLSACGSRCGRPECLRHSRRGAPAETEFLATGDGPIARSLY
jgi:cytosine/adenosine deaminase-related metal-dependent hydrolase